MLLGQVVTHSHRCLCGEKGESDMGDKGKKDKGKKEKHKKAQHTAKEKRQLKKGKHGQPPAVGD